MVKSNHGDHNIFNITQPQQYRCQMLHYHNRLSRLYIAVFKGQDRAAAPVFHLLFSDVAYLDLPMNWQGANFDIAPADDCIDLMLAAGLVGQALLTFPNAYASITDYAHLYRAASPHHAPIRIIANSANMLHQLPDTLLS